MYSHFLRAFLILSVFALSRRVLARLRRAKDVVYFVENARSAFSTKYTESGERRRREQAFVMGIRYILGVKTQDQQANPLRGLVCFSWP